MNSCPVKFPVATGTVTGHAEAWTNRLLIYDWPLLTGQHYSVDCHSKRRASQSCLTALQGGVTIRYAWQTRYSRDPQKQPNNMRKIPLNIYENSNTGLWPTWQPSFFHGSFRLQGCWLIPIYLLEQIHVGYTYRPVTLTLPIPTGLLPAGNVAQECRLDFCFLRDLVKKMGFKRPSLPSSITTGF